MMMECRVLFFKTGGARRGWLFLTKEIGALRPGEIILVAEAVFWKRWSDKLAAVDKAGFTRRVVIPRVFPWSIPR